MTARRFKLRFSFSNFHFCRLTKHSLPTFCFSPLNLKALDVSFPTGPQPPPSSPTHHHAKKGEGKIKTLKSLSSFDSNFSSFKFDGEDEGIETQVSSSSFESLCDFVKKKSHKEGLQRVMPSCRAEGSSGGMVVEEGMAVEKRSEEPYEDFKRSMLEMIVQKQMFEVVELENLLQCFLSLNPYEYHATIVEAFTEIWDLLFSDSESS